MIAVLTASTDGCTIQVQLHFPGPKRRIEWAVEESLERLADDVPGGIAVTDETMFQLKVGKERAWSYRATWTACVAMAIYVVQELGERGFDVRFRTPALQELSEETPEPIPFPGVKAEVR